MSADTLHYAVRLTHGDLAAAIGFLVVLVLIVLVWDNSRGRRE